MENYLTKEYRGHKINIYYDPSPDSPREWDNVATFVCEHRNYRLGDRHDIEHCVNELFEMFVPSNDIIKYFVETRQCVLKDNETFNPEAKVGGDSFHYYYEWKTGDSVDYILYDPEGEEYEKERAALEMADEMSLGEKLDLCEKVGELVWLPIAMYEHSGITLWLGSKSSHYDSQWDCGSIGFAYVTKDTAEKEKSGWHDEQDWKTFAYKQMEQEMRLYDDFCTGKCFGYEIEDENGDCINSCSGFIGEDEIERMIEEAQGEIDASIEAHQKEREANIQEIITNARFLVGQTFVSPDLAARISLDMFSSEELEIAPIAKSRIGIFSRGSFFKLPDSIINNMAQTVKSFTVDNVWE